MTFCLQSAAAAAGNPVNKGHTSISENPNHVASGALEPYSCTTRVIRACVEPAGCHRFLTFPFSINISDRPPCTTVTCEFELADSRLKVAQQKDEPNLKVLIN